MKRIILMFALMVSGLNVSAQAQTARQLYLGYGNDDKPVSAPTGKQKPVRKGKPGAKVVIERMRDGKLEFVAPGAVFRSGDKIRLRFAVNFDGYIKVLNVGSSGKISLLFPYDGADDRIKPSRDFQIPKSGLWIVFDDQPGTEILTVVLSRNPFAEKSEEELNREAGKSRDLTVQSDAQATYAVADEANLKKPVGFTLRLKHL